MRVKGEAMRGRAALVAVIVTSAALAAPAAAQEDGGATVRRAIPPAVTPPGFFRRALERDTRSADGSPGAAYWRTDEAYEIEATLDPETARLEGTARIRWVNGSPFRIPGVVLHLHQNLHAEGAQRNEPQEVTGGVTLRGVEVNGGPMEEGSLQEGPAWQVEGTLLNIRTPEPIEAGDTVSLAISWETVLPQNGAGRMGHSEREMYFVAYWFPKMAVLDDLRGWDAQPYLGGAEFYDAFGDYTVALTVPEGWTVMATGTLQNPEEVYTELTIARLAEAAGSDDRVVVASTEDLQRGRVTRTSAEGTLTWRFQAEEVRDFTWTTSNAQRWDATSAVVADRDGDGAEDRVLIHSFWREDRAPLWIDQWEFGKQSIEFHSRYTGFPYPWPHMTSVEGADIIGGGMEFPMLTLIGPYTNRQPQALFNVTSHELAHMWIPMVVGTNEKRHAWMDEGSTTFLEDESRMELWPGVDHHKVEAQGYYQIAQAELEQSMMRHGDWYEPGPGYGIASYPKPATLMVALRELVMEREDWEAAYRAFISEWAYKHPSPWDFFNTFERFAGEDLDWFWSSFYFETWVLDHAVEEVATPPGRGPVVRIEDRGLAPFPATVRIQTTDGGVIERRIEVEHWLTGNTHAEIELPDSVGSVTRVELNPSGYAPDANRSNDFWPRGG